VRARRISETYRRRLAAIAALFVECGRNKAATARRVQHDLGLKSFRAARLDSWADDPEWTAAVEAAVERASIGRELPPDARGAKLRVFAKAALAELEREHEDAKANGDAKAKKDAEARLLKIHDALRAEERHQDALKTSERMRSFRTFVSNLIAELAGLPPEHERRLHQVLANPTKLLEVNDAR